MVGLAPKLDLTFGVPDYMVQSFIKVERELLMRP